MSWDFISSNTQELTHCFHPYPAKMIPQIASKVIDEITPNAKTLFDPFCGTGTSLVEASIRGIKSIGCDLNPLARLIATTKTSCIEPRTLELYLKNFHDYIYEVRYQFNTINVELPKFENIDFWFSKNVQKDLVLVRDYIATIDNKNVKNFFLVAFSQTIRYCSYTRNDEFKLYKMEDEKVKLFHPDVFTEMESVLARNKRGLIEYYNRKGKAISKVTSHNSIIGIPKSIIENNSIDIVLTSPPYGDSTTTVAYGQFSALANQWIFGMDRPRGLDKKLMGGIPSSKVIRFGIDTLDEQISSIFRKDSSRVMDVVSFYSDYKKAINIISTKIRRKGIVCFVVSNRTVKGNTLSTDMATIEFFKKNKFEHIETFERRITNKRMPQKNSPTGIMGKKKSLMNKEFIIIMRKK